MKFDYACGILEEKRQSEKYGKTITPKRMESSISLMIKTTLVCRKA